MFDPIPDFLAQWWKSHDVEFWLAVVVFASAAMGFIAGTSGRRENSG